MSRWPSRSDPFQSPRLSETAAFSATVARWNRINLYRAGLGWPLLHPSGDAYGPVQDAMAHGEREFWLRLFDDAFGSAFDAPRWAAAIVDGYNARTGSVMYCDVERALTVLKNDPEYTARVEAAHALGGGKAVARLTLLYEQRD